MSTRKTATEHSLRIENGKKTAERKQNRRLMEIEEDNHRILGKLLQINIRNKKKTSLVF